MRSRPTLAGGAANRRERALAKTAFTRYFVVVVSSVYSFGLAGREHRRIKIIGLVLFESPQRCPNDFALAIIPSAANHAADEGQLLFGQGKCHNRGWPTNGRLSSLPVT